MQAIDLHVDQHLSPLATQFLSDILAGRRRQATNLINEALDAGIITFKEVYIGVFQPVLYQIGWMWETNRLTVADEHIARKIIEAHGGQIALDSKLGCGTTATIYLPKQNLRP